MADVRAPAREGVDATGAARSTGELPELALAFLKLGCLGFGGPAAHIAMMNDEFVLRRGWLSPQEFLDLVGMASVLPGPSSMEVAIFIGRRRAGWRGLVLAGLCFIVPASTIVTCIAWAYVRFGSLPRAQGVLYGTKPIIVAVLAQALWSFSQTAIKTKWLALVGAAGVFASAFEAEPMIVLLVCGALAAVGPPTQAAPAEAPGDARAHSSARGWQLPAGAVAWSTRVAAAAAASGAAPVGLISLFLLFLKVGTVLFGSGYVLLAFLRSDLVERLEWLTDRQLVDAVTVGQMTPGPVFTMATFIGYLLRGLPGAAVATLGIFLPSFLLVASSGFIVARVRRSPFIATLLDGINVGSLALMAVVTAQIARPLAFDPFASALAALALLLLVRFRVNSVWLVMGGALLGAGVYAGH